ncbi:MAG TPA: helix-turn-helix domain-containing protein [Gemmatimonadales bacterium]|nr:helix-turn-helix domain-containing protein [Gemmatimonadales bacterium]
MSYNSHFCPYFHRAVELIGKRWSGSIVREMLSGPRRFTELRGAIPDISDRMLCARLKGLEQEGIVERRVYAETPVRVEYQLTDKGRGLEKVFSAIGDWADAWPGCGKAGTEPGHSDAGDPEAA